MQAFGTQQRRLSIVTALALVAALWLAGFSLPGAASGSSESLLFGMDHASVDLQKALGATPDLASLLVGPWTLQHGWGGTDRELARMREAGVTPMVHFYYWGDDISIRCVEKGCWSDLHGVWKDRAGWDGLAYQLAQHLKAQLKGAPAVIVMESEFNKGNVATYEPLDGYLAAKAGYLRWAYPEAKIVLGFGNWDPDAWSTFDRAAGTADWTGLQAMRGSTRDSEAAYLGLVDATLSGVKTLRSTFGKPVLLTDLAVSSYPEPEYAQRQEFVVDDLFGRLAELKAHGLKAIVYRSLKDTPNMDLANHYGKAERHWGLMDPEGAPKPALGAWVSGVLTERGLTSAAVEGESFATRTAGGRQADASASGGRFWNLWSNGYLQHSVPLAAGHYELSLRVRGTSLGGVAPHMVVTWNGETVLEGDPAGGRWAVFTVRLAAAEAGPQALRVAFTNDAASANEDRNLWVDRIDVGPAPERWSVEVERFAVATAGARESDVYASGGARWNLWSNGYVQEWIAMPAGSYEVTVWAGGTRLGGVAPHMVVQMDGKTLLEADPSGSYGAYSMRVDTDWTWHGLRVRFTNDAWAPAEDRNLWVDRVEIRHLA